MAESEQASALWQEAGTDLIMLPTGMEVRWDAPTPVELVRRGVFNGALRGLAMRYAEGKVEPASLEGEDADNWPLMVATLIVESVNGAGWICTCPGCAARRKRDAVPVSELNRPTVEMLTADPPLLARLDKAALEDMVLWWRTPAQVDALARLAHGQMDEATAARIVREEEPHTLAGWVRFRGVRRSSGSGADRQDLGRAPVGAADHLAPGGRPRSRRRAGAPAAGRRAQAGGRKTGR